VQLEELLGEPLELLLAASPVALQVLKLEKEAAATAGAATGEPAMQAPNMNIPSLPHPAAAAAAGEGSNPALHSGGTTGGGFLLQQRARHVFTEAARVLLLQQVSFLAVARRLCVSW